MNTSLKNQKLAASAARAVTAKNFVKKPLILALAALALSATAVPAFATDWWTAMPKTVLGTTTVEVRNMGALGDGVHDDTAAFQAAINSLPATGGTVHVTAGRYMIDAYKSIRMHSHTRLWLDDGAELDVIPNNQAWTYVVRVWNVTDVRIVGGSMVGDRYKHLGTSGEWGMGVSILGSKNVVVKGTKFSSFWGDGIYVGAQGSGSSINRSDYITIDGVVSDSNRRQGMSITPAQHVYVRNSTFSNTIGTLPEAGIDIEPQTQGPTNTIRLEGNTFSGNHGNGIEMHTNISDITIVNNKMTGNRGFGTLSVSSGGQTITGNTMTQNGLAAVGATGTANHIAITNNTLQFNSTRYMSPTTAGGGLDRDLQIGTNTTAISVSGNIFSNPKYNTYTR